MVPLERLGAVAVPHLHQTKCCVKGRIPRTTVHWGPYHCEDMWDVARKGSKEGGQNGAPGSRIPGGARIRPNARVGCNGPSDEASDIPIAVKWTSLPSDEFFLIRAASHSSPSFMGTCRTGYDIANMC